MIIGLAGFKRTGKDTFAAEHFRKASYELISYEMERQHTPTTTEPPR